MVLRRIPNLINLLSNKCIFKPQLIVARCMTAIPNDECDEKHEFKVSYPRNSSLNPFDSVATTQSTYLDELTVPTKRSFNLAAYVNQSQTLQELIKLGVSLYDVENTNSEAAQLFVSLDFQKDCVNHIKFLVENGLKEKNLGRFISEYPLIFKEHIDDLQVRLNYLEHKGFTKKQITSALNRSSYIISKRTKSIDYKLGQLQVEFNMPAVTLREVVSRYPNVIAIPVGQYKLISFCLEQEFGFRCHEIHRIVLGQPKILEYDRDKLIERLDFVHNTVKLSHSVISKFPKLITGPQLEINQRFKYLEKLGRNQFDPKKPLYVPPSALYNISDEKFCERFAKTDLDDYKLFIKSL